MSGALSYLTLDGREVSNSARLAAFAAAGLMPGTWGVQGPACGVLQREALGNGTPCAYVGFADEFRTLQPLGPLSTPTPYLNANSGSPAFGMFGPQASAGVGGVSDGYVISQGNDSSNWNIPLSGAVWADGCVAVAFEPLAPVVVDAVRVYTHITGTLNQVPGNPPSPQVVGDYALFTQIVWQSATTARMTIEGRDSTGQYQPGFATGPIVTVPAGRQWLVLRTKGTLVTAEWWTQDPRTGGSAWLTLSYTLLATPFANGNGLSEIAAFGQAGVQGLGTRGQKTSLAFPDWWTTPDCTTTCNLYPSPFLYPDPALYPARCGSQILATTAWTDSSRPESSDFLGFYIDQIDGLDGDTSRDVQQRSGGLGGAALGAIIQMGRAVKVHGWLAARSCRGLDYGEEWLKDILAATCHPCPDSVMRIRTFVPSPDDGTADTQGLYYLYDVGLTDGPQITNRSADCDLAEVAFTITTGNGYLYQGAVNLLPTVTFASANGQVGIQIPTPPGIGTNGSIVTIKAGSQDLLNVYPAQQLATYPSFLLYPSLCLYPNNGGSPVTLPITTCASGFVIPIIPAGGTLIIDSSRHTITFIDAGGTVQDGTYLLSQDTARSIDWLEADACNPGNGDFVLVGASSYGPDATVQISYAHRER